MTISLDINDYVIRLLHDRSFLKVEYRQFNDNSYSICNVDGMLRAEVLFSAIKSAKQNRKIRKMLVDILWYANGQDITDVLFDQLMSFPAKYRSNFAYVLSHKSISFYQMEYINSHFSSYETFAWLIDQMCEFPCFTSTDIVKLLCGSTRVTNYGKQICIAEAKEKYGMSEKIEAAERWL